MVLMMIGGKGVIMRETLIVILNEREGSAAVMENTVKCHPERQRRIYYRSEEGGMKIKAISCELSAAS